MQGRVLIIAGSDSGGGAGIQGDIKTVSALGGYAATAITAITSQNTQEVRDIYALPPHVAASQISAVLDDIGADAIKTGMMWNADIVAAVVEALDRGAEDIPIVVDPVAIASSGKSLLSVGGAGGVKAELILRATLVTPNIPEAEALTGMKIRSKSDMIHAGEMMLSLGPRSVLITGGHLEGESVIDVLVDENGILPFVGSRIDAQNTHGTGCALASAIATGLAQGLPMIEAIERARAYVRGALESALDIGHGSGPINHGFEQEQTQ